MKRQDLPPVVPHQLALTMAGPFRISTVDLSAMMGSGHRLPVSAGPFETMVFRGESSSDLAVTRCATAAEALTAHETMVAHWLGHAKREQPADAAPSFELRRTVSRNLVMPECGDRCSLGDVDYFCTQTDFTDPERPVLRFSRSTKP